MKCSSENLQGLTIHLAVKLETVLKKMCGDSWWKIAVLDVLPKEKIKSGSETLKEFDLSALLQIFDQNWYGSFRSFECQSQDRLILRKFQAEVNNGEFEFEPFSAQALKSMEEFSEMVKFNSK